MIPALLNSVLSPSDAFVLTEGWRRRGRLTTSLAIELLSDMSGSAHDTEYICKPCHEQPCHERQPADEDYVLKAMGTTVQ